MKKYLQTLAAAAVTTVAMSGGAYAGAQLDPVRGVVLVNTGSGFLPASGPVALKAGDRVMVNPESKANIAFADGCAVPVTAGQVVTISGASPCSARAQGGGGYEPFLIGGLGAGFGIFAISQGLRNENTNYCLPNVTGLPVC